MSSFPSLIARSSRASSSKLTLIRPRRTVSTSPITSFTSIPPSTPSSSFGEATSSEGARSATHHLITLRRSAIGLPEKTKRTLEALGLHKLHRSVLQPMEGSTAGKILAVKELVTVENVTLEDGLREIERRRTGRKEGSGVEVVGRYGR